VGHLLDEERVPAGPPVHVAASAAPGSLARMPPISSATSAADSSASGRTLPRAATSATARRRWRRRRPPGRGRCRSPAARRRAAAGPGTPAAAATAGPPTAGRPGADLVEELEPQRRRHGLLAGRRRVRGTGQQPAQRRRLGARRGQRPDHLHPRPERGCAVALPAPPHTTRAPWRAAQPEAAAASAVLPMPASPVSRTTCPAPASAASAARRSRLRTSWRPTSPASPFTCWR
jgi:hypothetical protein